MPGSVETLVSMGWNRDWSIDGSQYDRRHPDTQTPRHPDTQAGVHELAHQTSPAVLVACTIPIQCITNLSIALEVCVNAFHFSLLNSIYYTCTKSSDLKHIISYGTGMEV